MMASVFETLHPIRNTLFQQKQAEAAWQMIEPQLGLALASDNQPWQTPEEKRAIYELAGLTLRSLGRYQEAAVLYRQIDDAYQAGYCEMLLGNLAAIQADWGPLLTQRNNHWCLTLFGLITQQFGCYPTIFQIRNHLECDIANLMRAQRWDYLLNLLNYADLLSQLNMESPKFMGRALLNYLSSELPMPEEHREHYWIECNTLLMKGQKLLPNDPEVYYHLGQLKAIQNQAKDARLMLNQCLLISPSYTPARDLLRQLQD